MSDSSNPGVGKDAEPREGPSTQATSAKKRQRRGRRTARPEANSKQKEPDAASAAFGGGLATAAGDSSAPEGGKSSKKRSSRRRRRKPSQALESAKSEAGATTAPKPETSPEEDKSTRRRRGTRGGRRRRNKQPDPEMSQAEDAVEPSEPVQNDKKAQGSKKASGGRKKGIKKPVRRDRKRRPSRVGRESRPVEIEFIPGEENDLPELAELPADAELVGTDSKQAKKKRRGRKKKISSAEAKPPEIEELPRDEVILVNAGDKLESRVCVVREERIGELFLEVNRVQSYVHNIYRGKVVNIESAIGAAFVDFGQGKNGFLHVSDVLPEYGEPAWNLNKLLEARELPNDDLDLSGVESDLDTEDGSKAAKPSKGDENKGGGKTRSRKGHEGSRPTIGDLLKVGDKVAVQITKDAIGDKGPALTTYISIPGRFLVLMPSLEMVGVSRKIEDEKERKRLRKIMQSFDVPGGMGLIVRTAGVGKTKADLKRDLDYLLALWDTFSKRLLHGRTPCALYQENDLAIRTMRDMFTRRTGRVVVDDEAAFNSMREFAEKLMPEHVDRIERHDGDRPLFHSFGIEQDYEKIFNRRVELPSGGSIVIDQTEALVAIDVNSGRTRGDGAVFEDIALKTNLEAVAEITLQIKLRDLGGILVLDFIDMMRKSSRLAVERTLRDAMQPDRARHKVGRISQFGLLELTRQRLGPGLSKLLYTTCLTCRGTGRQRTPEARAQGILRRLGSALTQKGFSKVEVRTQPEVVEYLEGHCQRDLDALSVKHKRELTLIQAPEQLEESVLRYLRTDGREVRPGGRRKKR